jgi:hypothetical protein
MNRFEQFVSVIIRCKSKENTLREFRLFSLLDEKRTFIDRSAGRIVIFVAEVYGLDHDRTAGHTNIGGCAGVFKVNFETILCI